MLDLKMKVIYTDGRNQSMKVRPHDAVRFEEKYDIALTDAFRRDVQPKMTYLYFLAWSASDTALEFDDWLRSIEEIEVGDADDAAPLVPATSDGSSPSSPSKPASRRKS